MLGRRLVSVVLMSFAIEKSLLTGYQDLGSAPCIKIECGHIFHYECVLKKIQKKWNTARITFAFVECPLCKKWISHSALRADLEPIKRLYEDVKVKQAQKNHL